MAFIFSFKPVVMLSIFILFFSLPPMVLSDFEKLSLPDGAIGPLSLAFDPLGAGPYTGISDGRILKYTNNGALGFSFKEFAFTSSLWSSSCYGIDAAKDKLYGPYCGRPLGLGFNQSLYLYITDAYFGLVGVGYQGGLAPQIATQLATDAEGISFRIPMSLDVARSTGDVYFVDFTSNSSYGLSDIEKAVANQDATGRLLKYDHGTKEVTVLLKGLSGPSGVAVSEDATFLLVTEFIASRIQKFWLQGSKANTSEIIITFEGNPANIRKDYEDFWVALNTNASSSEENVPTAINIDANGNILVTQPLDADYNSTVISEVQYKPPYLGTAPAYFIGSMSASFVGVYYSSLLGPKKVSTKIQPTVLATAK